MIRRPWEVCQARSQFSEAGDTACGGLAERSAAQRAPRITGSPVDSAKFSRGNGACGGGIPLELCKLCLARSLVRATSFAPGALRGLRARRSASGAGRALPDRARGDAGVLRAADGTERRVASRRRRPQPRPVRV